MSSKQQQRDQAVAKGYRCLGGRGNYSNNTHPKMPVNVPDPPAIVMCAYCTESVIGMNKRYMEVVEVDATGRASYREHRHQPEGNPKYDDIKPRKTTAESAGESP